MDLDEVLSRRRMTRRFEGRPVEKVVLGHVLGVLGHLPSAGFTQAVEALVLESAEARERFWAGASDPTWRGGSDQAEGLVRAPVVVVPLGDPAAYAARYGEPDKAGSGLAGRGKADFDVPYWLVDTSFAVLALLLAAEQEGLGALFFRIHGNTDLLLSSFGVPVGRKTVGALLLGWRSPDDRPSGSPTRRRRRPLGELVHRDAW